MRPKTIKSLTEAFKSGISIKEQVTVNGWIRSVRQQKQMTFMDVSDGSSLNGIQVVLSSGSIRSTDLQTGASVKVTGNLVLIKGKKQSVELNASDYTVLGSADPSKYPLHKARMSFKHLRDFQHLRSRTRVFGALWRMRHALQRSLHAYFDSTEFIQVTTPILTSHDCEGGGEAFSVSTGKSFFGKQVYTTVSGQLHAEMLACALSRVYTLSPAFRAEHSHSPRHLAEFWMLEAEECFIDTLPLLLDRIEAMLKFCITYILEKSDPEDLQLFDTFVEVGLTQKLKDVVSKPFVRMTYLEAIQVLQKQPQEQWQFPVEWGLALHSEHEKFLAEKVAQGIPVFVTDYPKALKPFYMKESADSDKTVACVDLLVPKIGELVGGSLREDDPVILSRRIADAGLSLEEYDWYVDLRRFGSVPHGGFGLGVERLLAFVTGTSNLKDLIPNPRTYEHCNF